MLRVLRLHHYYGNPFPAWRRRLATQRCSPGCLHTGRRVFRDGIGMAMFILDGDLPQPGVFAMLAPVIIPGILFLIFWALHRRPSFQT